VPILIEWIDEGGLQRGTLKKEDKSKIQVVSLTGRSVSLKAKRFHLRHDAPGDAAGYFAAVDADADEVDVELLHGALGPGGTHTLDELAASWFSSKSPSAREASVMLSACLDAAPWFKVDGAGRVRSASEEEVERWQGEQDARARNEAELAALETVLRAAAYGDAADQADADGTDLAGRAREHLRNNLLGGRRLQEWTALAGAVHRAADGLGLSRAELVRKVLEADGMLPPPYVVHMERFHRAFLGIPPAEPHEPGKSLHPEVPVEELDRIEKEVRARLDSLPPALHAGAFSVDDETTQEIDDALSAEILDHERFRVGVHIAAPGAFIREESAVHAAALSRTTTVYQPDLKWTMLPLRLVELFSLRAGRPAPCLSTYYIVSRETLEITDMEVRLEALTPAANHSYAEIDAGLEGEFIPDLDGLESDEATAEPDSAGGWRGLKPRDLPWARTSPLPSCVEACADLLVPFARKLYMDRNPGGPAPFFRREYRIKVSEAGDVDISERSRNGLAEGIVTELMILTNNRMARLLADAGLPAIYRTQRIIPAGGGRATRARADLTVNPREHAGLGASFYCWTTSPLRRYADLVNQRQLATLAGGRLPAFGDESELLVRAKKMEFQGQAADRHQRLMERYWTLRFMEKRPTERWPVTVQLQENRVRVDFDTLPLAIFMEPDDTGAAGVSGGPAIYAAESFDFYEVEVLSGALSSPPTP
jgi:exoribonuclease-2